MTEDIPQKLAKGFIFVKADHNDLHVVSREVPWDGEMHREMKSEGAHVTGSSGRRLTLKILPGVDFQKASHYDLVS